MKLTVLILTVVSTCLAQPGENNAAQQRSARAPQSKIQYHDPDGLRVDWKLYAPQNQWKSQLAAAQRAQRAETGTANFGVQKQPKVVQAPIQQEPNYQPYSAIPNHIKQLLAQAYAPQGPYVDPGAFFYQANAPIVAPQSAPQVKQDKSAYPQTQIERDYFNSAVTYRARGYQPTEQQSSQQIGRLPAKQGGIKYKNEERNTSERNAQLPYGSVIAAHSQPKAQYQPYKQIPQPQIQYQQYNKQASQPVQSQIQAFNQPSQSQPQYQSFNKQLRYKAFTTQASPTQPQYQALSKQPQLHFNPSKLSTNNEVQKPMSQNMAIQQLLRYQAELPYNVIANHILYRPKEPFVPKPLPESLKLSRQYPSKVYFVKTDGQVYESPDTVKDSTSEKRY